MLEMTLAAAVTRLAAAINARDAEAAEPLCTEFAWTEGQAPIAPLVADTLLHWQVGPLILETHDKGAARLTGLGDTDHRHPLWLLFADLGGWVCVEASESRADAEAWLKGERTPGDPSLGPVLSPILEREEPEEQEGDDDTLGLVVGAFAAALQAGDRVSTESFAEAPPQALRDELKRLHRHVTDSRCEVVPFETRRKGDRAAVRLALKASAGMDDTWAVFADRDGWKLVACTDTWSPAGLFVNRVVDDVPVWAGLPADVDAARWGRAVLEAAEAGKGAPEGLPDEAFAELTAPVPAATLDVGRAVSLPALGRALVSIDATEPGDSFPIESRWSLLERSPGGPWRFARTLGMGGLTSLLDGIEVPWEAPPPEAPEPALDLGAVWQDLKNSRVLDGQALGLDKMSKEQLEGALPQIIGSALGSIFANAIGRIGEAVEAGTPTAKAPAPGNPEARRVVLNEEFVVGEGPKAMAALLGAVAKAISPANQTVEVPPLVDGAKPVEMVLPIGDLLAGLFGALAQQAAKGPTPAADNNAGNAPSDPKPPDET